MYPPRPSIFLPTLIYLYQLVIKCSTTLFIFKQVFNKDITCNIIFSLDTYLLVVYDYVFSNYLEVYELMIGNQKVPLIPYVSLKHQTDTYFRLISLTHV